jgi:hypothetical protein
LTDKGEGMEETVAAGMTGIAKYLNTDDEQ